MPDKPKPNPNPGPKPGPNPKPGPKPKPKHKITGTLTAVAAGPPTTVTINPGGNPPAGMYELTPDCGIWVNSAPVALTDLQAGISVELKVNNAGLVHEIHSPAK